MSLWRFQPSRFWHGWDETGLSIFSGQPTRSLIREVIQNSLDAKADDADRVTVKFNLFTMPREAVPGVDVLTRVLEQCEKASANESEDVQVAVEEARKYSERLHFPILTCTDFGTTGMPGPYEHGKAFYTYMNTKGSSPGNSGRAGSHGHGKDAPLVNSELRTIFASSNVRNESGDIEHMAQGKCVFMSHYEEEEQYENIGQWGKLDMTPVTSLEAEHEWINGNGDKTGTTISIVGFNGKDRDWKMEMVGHALINYFPAFVRDLLELEFREKGEVIKLNSENFLDYFASDAVKAALKAVDQKLVEELDRTQFYVNSMIESRGGKLRDQQATSPLNLVHLYTYVDDAAPRKYCLIRRDMKITEEIPTLQRIPTKYTNFAMVVECQSDEANALIRGMEPSEHDKVLMALLRKDKQGDGKKLWKQMREKFLSVMDQEALPDLKISGQVDFLAKFFPDLANEDDGISFEDDEGFEGDRWQIKPIPKRKKEKRSRVRPDPDPPRPPEPEPPEPVPPDPVPPDPVPPEPVPPEPPKRRLIPGEIKSQRVVEISPNTAKLVVSLDKPETCYVSLAEVALDHTEALPIIRTSVGEIANGKVMLMEGQFDSDNKARLEVTVKRLVVGGYVISVEIDDP